MARFVRSVFKASAGGHLDPLLSGPSGRDEEDSGGAQVLTAFWFVVGLGVKEAWVWGQGGWSGDVDGLGRAEVASAQSDWTRARRVDLADSWRHLELTATLWGSSYSFFGFHLLPPGD